MTVVAAAITAERWAPRPAVVRTTGAVAIAAGTLVIARTLAAG